MPDYTRLKDLVRGKTDVLHLPTIYGYFPSYTDMIGGIPDSIRYYLDVEEKLRCQLKLMELFPEAMIFPGIHADFGVILEASAFGGKILWENNSAPHCFPILNDIKDIDHLKIPEPGKTGITTLALTQKRIMQEKLNAMGMEINKFSTTNGPAEVAGMLMGYEIFFMALIQDGKRIKTLMEMLTEYVIGWLKKQGEIIGGNEVIEVSDHVICQVHPDMTEEYILPYIQAIYSEFPESIKFYHNEGFHQNEHIEKVLRFGADVWHFGCDGHDIADVYEVVEDKITLFGGLNPHGNLRAGTINDVKKEAHEVKRKAKGRRLMFSSGTGTTPDTPFENMKAMIAVAAS